MQCCQSRQEQTSSKIYTNVASMRWLYATARSTEMSSPDGRCKSCTCSTEYGCFVIDLLSSSSCQPCEYILFAESGVDACTLPSKRLSRTRPNFMLTMLESVDVRPVVVLFRLSLSLRCRMNLGSMGKQATANAEVASGKVQIPVRNAWYV